MTRSTLHQQIIQLLLSTNNIFQGLSADDRKNLNEKEASPETNADKRIAAYLSSELIKIVPSQNIIIEDGEPTIGAAGESTWVIDPIDGTIPFMYDVPSYMVSMYEIKDNVIKSAFAYNPSTQDVFYSDGVNSFRNDVLMSVSTRDSLLKARIALSSHVIETIPDLYQSLRHAGAYVILQEGLIFRSSLVASGYLDATIQIGLRQFESGVVCSLVKNAGGEVRSSTQDTITFLDTSHNVVISNRELNDKLMSIVKDLASKTNDQK